MQNSANETLSNRALYIFNWLFRIKEMQYITHWKSTQQQKCFGIQDFNKQSVELLNFTCTFNIWNKKVVFSDANCRPTFSNFNKTNNVNFIQAFKIMSVVPWVFLLKRINVFKDIIWVLFQISLAHTKSSNFTNKDILNAVQT